MNGLGIILFIIIYFIIVIYMFYKINKNFQNLNNEINMLKYNVNNCNNVKKLELYHKELLKLNEKCWHRNFKPNIYEIKGIIETKYKLIRK